MPSFGAALTAAVMLTAACTSAATSDTSDDEETDQSSEETNSTDESANEEVVDLTDAILTDRSADCANYVGNYVSTAFDIKNEIEFEAAITITADDTHCTITSNSVPNHEFNDDTAAFAGGQEGATIEESETISVVSRSPEFADEPTFIGTGVKNAIFLNGIRLDIATAGCYRPTDPSAGEDGNVGFGCTDTDPWVLDALGSTTKFGADLHNAHTQPGGLYHYHGGPEALFDDEPGPEGSPIIGFAADGFPVYGSWFVDPDSGELREAVSGYTLKEGSRGERSDTNPGGDFEGEYLDDWEFTDAGDLDECNGMTIDGQYGYYVTDTYPWVIKCLKGTPDESFIVQGGPGGQGGPPQGQDGEDGEAPAGPPQDEDGQARSGPPNGQGGPPPGQGGPPAGEPASTNENES